MLLHFLAKVLSYPKKLFCLNKMFRIRSFSAERKHICEETQSFSGGRKTLTRERKSIDKH